MKWRIFTILSATSLLLCVAMVMLWLASWRMSPRFWSHVTMGSWGSAIEITCVRYPGDQTIWKRHSYSEFKRTYAGIFISLDHFTDVPGNPLVGFMVSVPYSRIVVALAILPVAWFVRRLVVLQRHALPGLCSNCGYDLRATPDRCPECGVVPGKI